MGELLSKARTITEPAKEVKVFKEAEVVVVGGGPAGVAAAVAAARNGAQTVLLERYGHLGGMATGGLVILIPHMSAGGEEQEVAGICQEMIERLDAAGGAHHPRRGDLGSTDKKLLSNLRYYNDFVIEGRVRMSVYVDPEILKCVLNDMVEEAGVKLFLHSWGSRAVVEGEKVQGVVFESKSGRLATLGKTVIDATGDGDIFASAGAEFDSTINPELRSSTLAVVFRLGNVDFKQFVEFKESEPEQWNKIMGEIRSIGNFRLLPLPSSRDDVMWVNNWVPGKDCLNVEDLTWVEVNLRKVMLPAHEVLKKNVPGFERSFILDTASQIGTRCSRRLIGEYIVTEKDIRSGIVHEDTIAVVPPFKRNVSAENPIGCIPYRALVPKRIENLLATGRCFSSDMVANDLLNLIPFCVEMGQAAGIAAALAVKDGVSPRQVNRKALLRRLLDQGAWLPKALR